LNFRKFFFYTGLIALILAALAVGSYFYLLNHYIGTIDNLMDILSAETMKGELPENEGKAGNLNEAAENNFNGAASGLETPEENATENTSTGNNNNTGNDPAASGSLMEKTPKGKTLNELEEKYSPALKNLELQDQLFTMQMLRKFSAGELQEMYRLYADGNKSRGELLKKLREKFTPEELQRIKEVYQKYKGLL